MNHELVERYIYAVTKRMPQKQREDVSLELRGLIEDMLAERCGELVPAEKDIRVVLTELGTPQELYAQYDQDAKKCLIGQPYYSTYKFVLKLVLLCVAVGLTVANLILQLMEPKGFLEAMASWFAYVWEGLIGSFAIVTILFAYFYHKGIQITEPFNFDDLPTVPKKKQEISRVDVAIGIGFDVVFLAIFLAAPQLLGMYTDDMKNVIPIFNVTAIRGSWYIIVLFGLLGVVREIVKLMEGRYNRRVLTVTVAADVLSAGLAAWWLSGADLFNPAFTQGVLQQVGTGDETILEIFENFPRFFLSVMILALALDVLNASVKALKD